MLQDWPSDSRAEMLDRIGHARQGDYAVFDGDNTLWQHDVTEAMMVWLERQGVRSLETLPPMLQPLTTAGHPSLWSYYRHLCQQSVDVGYLWVVQIFEGLSVRELSEGLGELLASAAPLTTTELIEGRIEPVEVHRPRPFAAQASLLNSLREAGVAVWVMSASQEDLVRAMVALPDAGFGIDPDRVCGVNLILKAPEMGIDCGAFSRARGQTGWRDPSWQDRVLSGTPVEPLTWYDGKVAGIRAWIDPEPAPFLVAGDSSNDLPMQKLVDPRGVRLRVHATREIPASFEAPRAWPGAGWVEVFADELSPRSGSSRRA